MLLDIMSTVQHGTHDGDIVFQDISLQDISGGPETTQTGGATTVRVETFYTNAGSVGKRSTPRCTISNPAND